MRGRRQGWHSGVTRGGGRGCAPELWAGLHRGGGVGVDLGAAGSVGSRAGSVFPWHGSDVTPGATMALAPAGGARQHPAARGAHGEEEADEASPAPLPTRCR